jgi:hypothetical protein
MPGPARTQKRLSLALVAALCVTAVGVGLLAHLSPVMPRYIVEEVERHRRTNGMYYFNGGYADAEDYVLVGQVLTDDHALGTPPRRARSDPQLRHRRYQPSGDSALPPQLDRGTRSAASGP